MKIFDCFYFFNEYDLLEMRLKYLDKYVDYFVISEADYVFGTRTKKPLNFLANKDRYKQWEHKIIYNTVTDIPESFVNYDVLYTNDIVRNQVLDILRKYNHYPHQEWHWANEAYQKECLLRGLNQADDDDIIMVSDLDEFPKTSIFENLNVPKDNRLNLIFDHHWFYVNVVQMNANGNKELWGGTNIFRKRYVFEKREGLNSMRMNKNTGINVLDIGWHFSYLGGPDQIKKKINAYGHQEYNNEQILSRLENCFNNNTDIYGRNYRYAEISLDSFPENFKQIVFKYPQFIKRIYV